MGETREALRKPVSGSLVRYDAHVCVIGPSAEVADPPIDAGGSDEEKHEALRTALKKDGKLNDTLQQEAQTIFGPAFQARVLDVQTGSVHVVVILYAEEQTSVVVADFRKRASVVFAERVRTAIRQACGRAGWAVLDETEATGEILGTDGSSEAEQKEGKPWDQIAPVLAAVATGIGVLGFVAFVGGAIEFGRLYKAGLPAEEALAIIPKANLISVGAVVLVPALVLALVMGLVMSLWQLWTETQYQRLASGDKDIYAADTTRLRRLKSWRRAIVEPGARALVLAFLFICFTFAYVAFSDPIHALWIGVLGAIIAMSAVALFAVARRSRSFLWVGATAFVAASVFASTMEYGQTKMDLEARPAAAVRDGTVIRGYFIAESASQIYLGRRFVPVGTDDEGVPDDVDPRILVLPKDEVNDVMLGPLMPIADAEQKSFKFARELCRERAGNRQALGSISPKERTQCDRILLAGTRRD